MPERRIARGGDGLARFLGVLHKGNKERTRAHVERALDDDHVIPRHAEDRLGSAAAHGLQLRQQRGDVVRCVFAVDDNPIEARAGDDLCRDRIDEPAPEADLPLLFCECLLECVARQVSGPFGHEAISLGNCKGASAGLETRTTASQETGAATERFVTEEQAY